MTYQLLRFVHLLGLCLMAAGLIGVWYADVRSRRNLRLFAEAIRTVAVFYDGLVSPAFGLWHQEGDTTGLYFMRLRRLAKAALKTGAVTLHSTRLAGSNCRRSRTSSICRSSS